MHGAKVFHAIEPPEQTEFFQGETADVSLIIEPIIKRKKYFHVPTGAFQKRLRGLPLVHRSDRPQERRKK